jgi:hypothetical protein
VSIINQTAGELACNFQAMVRNSNTMSKVKYLASMNMETALKAVAL